MALRELPSVFSRLLVRDAPTKAIVSRTYRRYASGEAGTPVKPAKEELANKDFQELESESSLAASRPSEDIIKAFDPVKKAKGRRRELPASRYQYKSPRYYRGPLHPHQPPPVSDPSSRLFTPGPFSYNRLEQTYESTVAQDLMTLAFTHKPPGTVEGEKAPRLREWDNSSPYMKGRPKRGPRGGDVLRLIEKDINWRNIPKIERVVVHSMISAATTDSAALHVAGIMLQAVTGVRPVVHKAKHSVAQFGIRAKMPISLTCEMRGDQAYEFIDKCINLVMPKIKDWPGVEGSTGDSSGNIHWGFDREAAILFPEVEVNYDMYPPKMVPGFHVNVQTTAKSDRHARLLMSALGVPFYGKLVD
ncbi:putative 50S ribosomal protein L5 [Coleophoma crateriformis]|uniref:Large ribosomal subunit protein uL5m n=1 Tax=Coleophoma crateriformis TaxID=565419 RepID=A0A3D8R8D0_9HELO|nr:putative 50S ribosomal protein L5 [Coleophoma crateriformis]